jgi:endonuclease YncB( thermonuclease family)
MLALDPARRPLVALWIRTAALAAGAAAAGFMAVTPAPRADQARPSPVAEAPMARKGAERLGSTPDGPPAPGPAALFRPEPFGATRFAAGAPPSPALRHGFTPDPPDGQARPWIEREFAAVEILDGRTVRAEGVRIRLIGLDLPMPEQMCRTLDGRLEPCATRAATQLELMTRGRAVTCLHRLEQAGEAVGRCRIGFSDLTERMIRTGFAWPSAGIPVRSTL